MVFILSIKQKSSLNLNFTTGFLCEFLLSFLGVVVILGPYHFSGFFFGTLLFHPENYNIFAKKNWWIEKEIIKFDWCSRRDVYVKKLSEDLVVCIG